jgi:hypothetical protein
VLGGSRAWYTSLVQQLFGSCPESEFAIRAFLSQEVLGEGRRKSFVYIEVTLQFGAHKRQFVRLGSITGGHDHLDGVVLVLKDGA